MFLFVFMVRDRLSNESTFFVKSRASRWTGRCFDEVLCLVNSDDKNLDS